MKDSEYKVLIAKLKRENEELKRKVSELDLRYNEDCITINQIKMAYLVTVDELAKLRKQMGLSV